jgi:hypothetical protein
VLGPQAAPAPSAPRAPGGATELDQAVSGEVMRLQASYWDGQLAAAERKTVILVEGDDDRDVIEIFLKRRAPTFETRVRVVPAGGRERVIERMKSTFPHAYALVDRDTWTDAEVAARRQAEPRLYITGGWCLENAFLGPDALRRCGARAAAEVTRARERWVRAGALWWTLQRAREAQQRWQETLGWTYGSARTDLALESGEALAKSLAQKIPAEVRHEAQFDVDAVAATFTRRCAEVLALPEAEQWRTGVHGKRAFVDLLVPALQSTPGAARLHLAGEIDRPSPIDELVALVLP